MLFAWEDNAQFHGIDVLIYDESHPFNPRVQGGSLFDCEGQGYTRYSNPGTIEENTFMVDCDTTLTAGDVLLYISKRADETMDYQFDGQWFTSALHKDAGITDFEFGDVHLRLRGTDGTTAGFRDFQYRDNRSHYKDSQYDIHEAFLNRLIYLNPNLLLNLLCPIAFAINKHNDRSNPSTCYPEDLDPYRLSRS